MYFGDQMAMDDALDAQIEELHQRIRELKVEVVHLQGREESAQRAIHSWIKENGPDGWIDNLRRRVATLEAALREIRDHPWSVLNIEYHSAEIASRALELE